MEFVPLPLEYSLKIFEKYVGALNPCLFVQTTLIPLQIKKRRLKIAAFFRFIDKYEQMVQLRLRFGRLMILVR